LKSVKNNFQGVFKTMSILKSKHVFLRVGAIIFLALFARTYSVHANPDAADEAMNTIRPEAIRADMRFLSDDALEGRGTGSRGYDIAAKFMATQFESLGLQPAGDNRSYFQNVPLRLAKPDEAKTSLVLSRSGKDETLTFRKDYISRGDPVLPESSVEAPVVFVGDGVTAPDQNYDDYQDIDAKGKIVALMAVAPNFESSLKAHYSSSEVKLRNAVAHGAVGVILLDDPVFEGLYSFKEQVRDLSFPELRWLDKQQRPNDYFPELKGNAFLSLEATKRFFAGSAHSAEEVFAAMKAGKTMSFVMPISAKIRNVTGLKDVAGRNVVAKLEGSDATLKNEYLVYSAHLDHLGIGEPVKGDSIYNGALDNASGSAILLEVARAFSGMKTRPRRSILFLSVTGEEAGLLGSDYFAHYPTVGKTSVVANVNMDEDLMLWPLRDIVAFGAEHSSLDAVVKKAAARLDLSESPDPNPEEVVFIRSDQYSFVKQGVPAIFPVAGFKSDDPKIKPADIFKNWELTRYHQPQDDMDQPGLDWDAAAKYTRFVFLCGWLITEDSQRPTWNKGDFFGEHYAHQAN
jgi:Peptidase family M28/PA domain